MSEFRYAGGQLAAVGKAIDHVKQNRERLFWTWIAYQTVKGTLTTTIIWVPALAYWFS